MNSVTFAELGVAPPMVASLKKSGIEAPFPIQIATIPDAIAGRDVLARGQTGSGKTLAFGLAVLSRLQGRKAKAEKPLSLILVPTRELAMQVSDTLSPLATAGDMRIRLVVGGMPYSKQITAIQRGVHLLVATPGRLIDLVNRGDVDLSDVAITVLDEADQMADMGFLPVVREILDLTRPQSQRLLFSATLDGDVDSLVRKYMQDPARHSLQPVHAQVATMDHHVLVLHPADKDVITAQIGARDGRTLFFVKTQRGVDKLAGQLAAQGIAVGALHGGKSQAVRTRTLAAFRDGLTPALVATDVAARGIHVDGVTLVVHVDAPQDPKDYLHRAGRTARAGESGTVVTLAYPKQQRQVAALTGRAGVHPNVMRVKPGDVDLVSATGAREPSGVAWIAPPAPRERGAQPAGRRRSGSSFKPRSQPTSANRPATRTTENRSQPTSANRPATRTTENRSQPASANRPATRTTENRSKPTTRNRPATRTTENRSKPASANRPATRTTGNAARSSTQAGSARVHGRTASTQRRTAPATASAAASGGKPARTKKARHRQRSQ